MREVRRNGRGRERGTERRREGRGRGGREGRRKGLCLYVIVHTTCTCTLHVHIIIHIYVHICVIMQEHFYVLFSPLPNSEDRCIGLFSAYFLLSCYMYTCIEDMRLCHFYGAKSRVSGSIRSRHLEWQKCRVGSSEK